VLFSWNLFTNVFPIKALLQRLTTITQKWIHHWQIARGSNGNTVHGNFETNYIKTITTFTVFVCLSLWPLYCLSVDLLHFLITSFVLMGVYNSPHRFLHGYFTFNYVLLLRLYMGGSFVNTSYSQGEYYQNDIGANTVFRSNIQC